MWGVGRQGCWSAPRRAKEPADPDVGPAPWSLRRERVARQGRARAVARVALGLAAALALRAVAVGRAARRLALAFGTGRWAVALLLRELRQGELSVRDHGPGFAEADLPHVFERFFRAEAARGLPGSGLGLAIVRQAAEAHGG